MIDHSQPLATPSVGILSDSPDANAKPLRRLKIEADGDPWRGKIAPKIRLKGRWLEQAGFRPDTHVHVRHVASGVMELRAEHGASDCRNPDSPPEHLAANQAGQIPGGAP